MGCAASTTCPSLISGGTPRFAAPTDRIRAVASKLLTVRLILRMCRTAVVALAAMLVLAALIYGSVAHRDDVVAVTVAEVLLVGAAVAVVRFWRARRRAV
jgi:hypothetical protein